MATTTTFTSSTDLTELSAGDLNKFAAQFTVTQVGTIDAAMAALLTDKSLLAIGTKLKSFSSDALSGIAPKTIAALDLKNISDITVLSTDQWAAFTVAQTGSLTATQLSAATVDQIAALNVKAIPGIKTASLGTLALTELTTETVNNSV